PASRKARALLAYLAVAPQPVARSQLCELLCTVPNDPRGELRWCLSKLRSIIDEPGRARVQAHDDRIRLELGDCDVDALAVSRATAGGLASLEPAQQRALLMRFGGDFADGLEID